MSTCRITRSIESAAGAAAPPATAEILRPQLEHEDERLADDVAAHLRLAVGAVAERDRELDDPAAGAHDAVGHLDLEAVAVGLHGLEHHSLQRVGRVRPVAR